MRRYLGIFLVVLGVLGASWCGLVGGSFTAVYLLGYIGTNGNEAGRELAFMASATIVGIVIGCLIAGLGIRLNSQAGTRRHIFDVRPP
ncbi:MAG: hypothetical protein QM769_02900 [Pseudoxanthomonas sp.]